MNQNKSFKKSEGFRPRLSKLAQLDYQTLTQTSSPIERLAFECSVITKFLWPVTNRTLDAAFKAWIPRIFEIFFFRNRFGCRAREERALFNKERKPVGRNQRSEINDSKS